jgi:hypothetical protein
MSTAKQPAKSWPTSFADSRIRVEDSFFAGSLDLRSQFVEHISLREREQAGVTRLTYVFCAERYQFLTAAAEQIFASETLEALISSLSSWGRDELGTSHVSTPQLRVFVGGCARTMLQDDVMLGWHYQLSLTSDPPPAGGRMQVMPTKNHNGKRNFFGISEFVRCKLTLNQLLVHDTQCAYGIEPVKSSMAPLDGVIFLDGYLW